MIKIIDLNKKYDSKKRQTCKALNNINLTLPDAGLIFVLGKSGSGKSTLLNLIGGLDNISSGQIIVDGNDLSTFNENDFCNYRNSHIGFIFQDYHLIDELTVYENIVLSLDLQKKEDKENVKTALAKVDLEGYEDRYPSELSGGEQQRVAIARAIVKNPRLILADEPTGNLDTNTAKSIIELLKSLSKECLILIVSHNINDANKYADRIIELKKGEIIADKEKNPEYPDDIACDDGVIYYPSDKKLEPEDIDLINESLDKNEVKRFVRVTEKFIPTKSPELTENNVPIHNNTLSLRKEMKFSSIFLKSKATSIMISSIIVSAVMVILALAQTIINFDGGIIISREMKNATIDSLLLQKATTEMDKKMTNSTYQFYKEITDEDISAFKDTGYTNPIYEVNSFELILASSGANGSAGILPAYLAEPPFVRSTLGTIIVDEEFLEKKFGQLEYIAKLDEFHPSGVIITDYIADAILANNSVYKSKTYEDILGSYHYSSNKYNRGYINGIIKTDYREKYKNIFDAYYSGKRYTLAELNGNQEFLKFSDDVYAKYGYCFSFNPDFKESFIHTPATNITYHGYLKFGEAVYLANSAYIIFDEEIKKQYKNIASVELEPNEVIMNFSTYNKIFGTNYTAAQIKDFTPQTLTLSHYRRDDVELKNSLWEEEIVIKQLTNNTTYTFIASEELYRKFQDDLIFNRALYFENSDKIGEVLSTAEDLEFTMTMTLAGGIRTMTRAVEVFIPIFEIIAWVLYFAVIFVLINFSMKMISDKMHDIGILKAIGAKNRSVAIIFGLQIILIAILTCVMSTIGYYCILGLANNVLLISLRELAANRVRPDIDFLTFRTDVALANCLLTFILSGISLVLPMKKIKEIKPVKIIKTRE